MSRKDVQIRIDRLILQGVDPRHRARIAAAIERELTRLVTDRGLPPHWQQAGASGRGVPRVEISPGQAPARIGATVARAIYRGGK